MTASIDHVAPPDPERGITLWGAPGAGKSGLLGALYAASLRRGADGWSAHVRDCDDEHSQERLKEAYLGLLERANAKTGIAPGGYQPLRLTLRRARRGRAVDAVRVALVDPAGEFSTQLELGTTPEGRALFSRVARGGGVLWLFEARGDAYGGAREERAEDVATRMLTLQHLVALLEQTGGVQLALPVALCLSKTDHLAPDRRDAARRDPEAALREHLGEAAFTWFEAVCPVKRCFTVSSTGAPTGPIHPEGLDDVFDWLAAVTRRPVSWRDRLGGLLGALPRATRGAARVLALAGAAVAAAAAIAVATPRAAGWLADVADRARGARADTTTVASARPTRSEAGGEVARDGWRRGDGPRGAGPREAARRGAPLDARAARALLEEAAAVARHGAWLAALRTLGDDVPPPAMRFAWDSLYLVAALAAARGGEAPDARELHARVRARAAAVVGRGPPGARRLVGARFARAVACMDGALGCPVREVAEDLTWALLGPGAMRREAKARLRALGAPRARGVAAR